MHITFLTLMAAAVLVIEILALGLYNWETIAVAAAVGLVLTWPVSYVISRRIKRGGPKTIGSDKPQIQQV